MADKRAIMTETLDLLAKGFQKSRGITDKLTTKQMIAFAEEPTASGENKLAQLVEGTLTEITAEDLQGITKIRDYAFYRSTNLEAIEFPNTITYIGNNAFQCESGYSNNLANIVFPNSITYIGGNAFYANKNLESVVLPQNALYTTINSQLFFECSKLNNVILPNNIVLIDTAAFRYCYALSNITLSNTLQQIYSYAFRNCNSLTNLIIPSSVITIGSATLQCGTTENKTTFTFLGTTPPTIYNDTFRASQINKIIVPKGCGEAYKSATNWANFADYIEEAAE